MHELKFSRPQSVRRSLSALLTVAWPSRCMRRTRRLPHALAVLAGVFSALAGSANAQAPLGSFAGRWIDVGATAHRVSNDLGDWRGVYVRTVAPAGASDVFWADVLALEAFGERGLQVAVAHRHDWNGRIFHLAGVTAADGAPIFPRVRGDVQLGLRLGSARNVVATVGVSHVRSVEELTDAAFISSVAWYAPRGFILEGGVRANTSWPGRIQTARFSGAATWMSAERSLTLRAIGGEEGWQILSANQSLIRFSSTETSLAWRERLGARWSTALQVDHYTNPTYTRTGVSLGVARSW